MLRASDCIVITTEEAVKILKALGLSGKLDAKQIKELQRLGIWKTIEDLRQLTTTLIEEY